MKHVILELLCAYEAKKGEVPPFCRWGPRKEGTHCVMGDNYNLCRYLGHTIAPDEIAYSDSDGNVATLKDWIGFGGDMEDVPEKDYETLVGIWQDICREKIAEALKSYYERVGKPMPDFSEEDSYDQMCIDSNDIE